MTSPRTEDWHVEYRVVTPLMLGGHDHRAEWRLESFVALVRWWWRALAWAEITDRRALALQEAVLFGHAGTGGAGAGERRSDAAPTLGQGRALFRLGRHSADRTDDRLPRPIVGTPTGYENDCNFTDRRGLAGTFGQYVVARSGLYYLTAQGIVDFKTKEAVRLPLAITDFAVDITFRRPRYQGAEGEERGGPAGAETPEAWNEALTRLARALHAIGLLGGLGLRWRRGFGSLAINRFRGGEAFRGFDLSGLPADEAAYAARVESCLGTEWRTCTRQPPYSAVWRETKVHFLGKAASAADLHELLGWGMQAFRSYGQKRRDGSRSIKFKHPVECDAVIQTPVGSPVHHGYRGFRDDHAWYAQMTDRLCRSGQNSSGPSQARKLVFGLPMNYKAHFEKGAAAEESGPFEGSMQVIPVSDGTRGSDRESARRASPLLLHIHLFEGQAEAIAVATSMPSVFLPSKSAMQISGSYTWFDNNRRRRKAEYTSLSIGFGTFDFSLFDEFAAFLRAGRHIVRDDGVMAAWQRCEQAAVTGSLGSGSP